MCVYVGVLRFSNMHKWNSKSDSKIVPLLSHLWVLMYEHVLEQQTNRQPRDFCLPWFFIYCTLLLLCAPVPVILALALGYWGNRSHGWHVWMFFIWLTFCAELWVACMCEERGRETWHSQNHLLLYQYQTHHPPPEQLSLLPSHCCHLGAFQTVCQFINSCFFALFSCFHPHFLSFFLFHSLFFFCFFTQTELKKWCASFTIDINSHS